MAQIEVARSLDLVPARLDAIRDLLLEAFEGDFSAEDWRHSLGGWHVMVFVDGRLVAHAAVVARALEVGTRLLRAGYVEAVATAPPGQGQGVGSLVMQRTGDLIRSEFEMGALSTGRPSFYQRAGWERWQGPSYVRDGERRMRTADEDDGIMVLRFGATLGLDLTQPICCERRQGDDW